MAQSNWIYEGKCAYCQTVFVGKEKEVQQKMSEYCEPSKNQYHKHYGPVFPKFISDKQFKCNSCSKVFTHIEGSSATEYLCDKCADEGKIVKTSKKASDSNLNCDINISYSSRNLFGKSYSHIRKEFTFRGEDWACCGKKSNYDTLSGSSDYTCGKRASIHVELPHGVIFQNGDSVSQCGVVCDKCASYYLSISGAKNIGF